MPAEVTRLDQDSVDLLHAWYLACPWRQYRNYPLFTPEKDWAVLRDTLCRALADPRTAGWIERGDDGIRGFGLCVPNDWESRYFGVKSMALTALGTAPAAWDCALDHGASADVVSLKLDSEASDARQWAATRGFQEFSAMTRYLYHAGVMLAHISNSYRFRLATPDDADALIALAREGLSGAQSRFIRDTRFPRGPAERLYEEWAAAACRGTLADYSIMMAFSGGQPVAFLACHLDTRIERLAGVRMYCRGLACAASGHPRALPAIYVTALAEYHVPHCADEFDTDAGNVSVVRWWQRIGLVHACSWRVMHRWPRATLH